MQVLAMFNTVTGLFKEFSMQNLNHPKESLEVSSRWESVVGTPWQKSRILALEGLKQLVSWFQSLWKVYSLW